MNGPRKRTPWEWRKTAESPDDSPEELCAQNLRPDRVFTTYNAAMEKIVSISDSKVEPLTFRLKTEWDKATHNEQRLCVEKVDEACRAVCQVIAPCPSEQLQMAYVKSASTSRSQVEALISTYKQAPSKTLKTQILIYMHCGLPFMNSNNCMLLLKSSAIGK